MRNIQTNPDSAKAEEIRTVQSNPAQPKSVQSKSVQPKSVQSKSVQPKSVQQGFSAVNPLRMNLLRSIPEKTLKTSLLIAVLFAVLGGLVFFMEKSDDTVSSGYLERGDYGTGEYTKTLRVTIGGEEKEVEVRVGAREYTAAETEAYLAEACEKLEENVLKGTPASHVDRDLNLMESAENSPVAISWVTSPPNIMDYTGAIGENIPENGTALLAEAELSLQGETRNVSLALTVFPRVLTAEEELKKKIEDALEREDPSSEKLALPQTLGGQSVAWADPAGSTGLGIAALGLLAAVLYLFSRKQNVRKEEEKRRSQMMLDYPHVISKLTLLLGAGMSMRKAIEKMTKDYRQGVKKNGRTRAGFEEIARIYSEMEKGVPETEAYEYLGIRNSLVKYRTLSTILIQNLKRGSRELVCLLEQEAAAAFEDRKKQARILGEEAGTKLLLPMFLMLLVVMIILVVPAFVKFG